MAVLGFSVDPGPLPFATVRDLEKWLPRLTNGQIEIRSEGSFPMVQRMVSVAGMSYPHTADECRALGLHVPGVYAGRRLMIVHLQALDG